MRFRPLPTLSVGAACLLLAVALVAMAREPAATSAAAIANQPSRTAVAMTGNSPLRMVYFLSPSCNECRCVRNFLPQVIERWGNRIDLELYSIENISVFNELFKYEKYYGAKVVAPPAIFVGNKVLPRW